GFEVRDQRLDFGLGLRRKVFGRVELSHAETQGAEGAEAVAHAEIAAAYRKYGALPARLLLLLAGQSLVAHLEIGIGERLGEIRGGIVDDVKGRPGLQRGNGR